MSFIYLFFLRLISRCRSAPILIIVVPDFFLGAYTGTDGWHYSIDSMVKGSNNLFLHGVEAMRRVVVLCPLFHYFGEFVPDCSSEVPKGFRGTVAEPW